MTNGPDASPVGSKEPAIVWRERPPQLFSNGHEMSDHHGKELTAGLARVTHSSRPIAEAWVGRVQVPASALLRSRTWVANVHRCSGPRTARNKATHSAKLCVVGSGACG